MSSSMPAAIPTGAPSGGSPPPVVLPLRVSMFLKFWTLGIILSAIAYGIAFTLFASCFYLLKKTSAGKRRAVHYFLFAYITVMFGLSTISIVSGIKTVLQAISTSSIPRNLNVGPDGVVIVLTTWGSDGFLIWRASILYEGVGMGLRHAVYVLLGFMTVAQTGTGIAYILSNFVKSLAVPATAKPILIAFSSTTLFVNWVITALVVGRLMYFRRKVTKTLGNTYGAPYSTIISMCVESAALVIFWATIFLTLSLMGKNPFELSRAFLVHIYVIAPFLILYRVAQGKAWLTDTQSFYTSRDGSHTLGNRSTTLRFNSSALGSTHSQTTKIEVNVSRDENYVKEDMYAPGVYDNSGTRDVEMSGMDSDRMRNQVSHLDFDDRPSRAY